MKLSLARSCDILEKKKEFVITADLPGLAKAGPGARGPAPAPHTVRA